MVIGGSDSVQFSSLASARVIGKRISKFGDVLQNILRFRVPSSQEPILHLLYTPKRAGHVTVPTIPRNYSLHSRPGQ
jgi:hypothetical protein